ncbi:uncharacterized protein LOC121726128 [Aricia agestis]|uniref:uncharacterized protein LOC121726128 n=1 Tax=Aricia agestis TaxID=91739 RepID=UPI001C20A44E|nr:uncharacterized protein LOC121726128 [Aricia agestis]
MAETPQDIILRLEAEKAALQQRLERQNKPEICKVSVKLSPFWPNKPKVWFAQVEAQFELSGIKSDTTMFNYIISQLDQKLAGEVDDIITAPPTDGTKYLKLKEELIRRLSMSEEQRVRQLVGEEELGDRKPSQFLRHLRSLSNNALTDESILRQLWMRRLPQQVQAILVSQTDLTLEKLADLADKVIEIAGPSKVFSCSSPASSFSSTVFDTLLARVDELSKQVASLTHQRPGRSRSRNASAGRRSRTSTPGAPVKMCWYHKKFNTKAAKCIQPCSWSAPQENGSNSQ